ncbi:MAG: hypothetical protein EXS05_17845 [Planctomycetaceae bacterium]|nr:hypothetical protein [Planctomycetaceae bacterium]
MLRSNFKVCCSPAFLSLAVACLLSAGCGSDGAKSVKMAKAGGTVLYKGAPLAEATVTFIPENGPIALARTDLKGKFTLMTGSKEGAAVGNGIFTVEPIQQSKQDLGKFAKGGSDEERKQMQEKMMNQMKGAGNKTDAAEPSLISPKYKNPETSPLQFTVSDDPSKNDFALNVSE